MPTLQPMVCKYIKYDYLDRASPIRLKTFTSASGVITSQGKYLLGKSK